MTQRSLHWDGASLGDADNLTVSAADGIGWRLGNTLYESPFVDWMFRALWNGTGNRGVLRGWLNELAVTGVVTPVSINTGAAIIFGLYYENNTAPVTKAIASPTNDTRYDRVVVRRNWLTQTARITVITGVEGGGLPAITQSPAPSGSGLYDIPLASLEVDTLGNITVTDEREFCTYSTGFADDAFGSAHLATDSVDWTDRATRTKRLFLGGGDLQPNVNAGRFNYGQNGAGWDQVGPPVWGGAANEEAWRTTGASTSRRGLYTTFRMPADYAGGNATTYIWWVNNAVVAATFYLYSAYQLWPDNDTGYEPPTGSPDDYAYTYITSSGAVSDVYRTAAIALDASDYGVLGQNFGTGYTAELTEKVIHYAAAFYNTAGAEDIGIMGIEVNYTGYT